MSSRLIQHIWGNQRAVCQSVQTIKAFISFSLDTITPVSSIVEDFCCFSEGEVGQCFVWVNCVQGPMSSPPTDCHDSAVMSESVSTKHSLQGDANKCTVLAHLQIKKTCGHGCYVSKESLERHLKK